MIKQAKVMILKAIASHPMLTIFGITLAMTIAVATTVGIEIQHAYACHHVLVADGH
jgi:hypothetical protein